MPSHDLLVLIYCEYAWSQWYLSSGCKLMKLRLT